MREGIGSTLRKARDRRQVDLAEVEAATKIRLRYLRAIESEEWEVLPGGPYARGFIRTYAAYLGLDGERLAEEYRREVGGAAGEQGPRSEAAAVAPAPAPRARRRARGAPRLSNRAWTALVSLGLIAVLVAVGLAGGPGGSGVGPSSKRGAGGGGAHAARGGGPAAATPPRRVAVRLTARAEVWVCLLDAAGRKLIDGRILTAGAEEGPFRSSRFKVAFGNGEVEMSVDGRRIEVPASGSPIGYAVGAGGALRPLSEAERPSCA